MDESPSDVQEERADVDTSVKDPVGPEYCDPCKLSGLSKNALMYCKECEEKLCEACVKSHAMRKATSSHTPIPIEDMNKASMFLCSPCSDDDKEIAAISFCRECEEYLCEDCTNSHKKRKATKLHSPTVVELLQDQAALSDSVPSCQPCKERGDNSHASKYCKNCDEYLCDNCTRTHSNEEEDCESCQTPGTAESLCKECEQYYCKSCSKQQSVKATVDHKLVSIEAVEKKKEARSSVADEVEEAREQDTGLSKHKDAKTDDYGQSEKIIPGKPKSSDVLADSIILCWDPPSKFGDNDYYQIRYKDLDHEKKWKFIPDEFKSSSAVINGLKSNTAFIFRVRVVYEDAEGPYSEDSDKIYTLDSPASRVVKFSPMMTEGDPSPAKYALPVTEVKAARNETAKTKKFELGSPPQQEGKSKTIMLVGATGTGKSTFVDGIVNYVLGVNWDDPFRFTVIDLEQEEKDRQKNQALSQTEWITCYTLNPEKGSRLKYQLNIIDTPGFGDTRGLKRDQEIVEQIRQLFSDKQPRGVTFIDAVCFLIKAPDARLTAIQSYIFQSIMSLFGKDIEKNICSLITFADGIDPPVLAALQESGLPFGKSFTFNNSGLFAKNANISTTSLSPIFWDMGLKSFRAFFDHLEQVETKSLQLTKDVLDERSRLEATVKNLQPQMNAGLLKVNCLKQEIKIIEENESLIKDNKDFEYEVPETQQKKKELPRGRHVTNCTNCHFTCHDNCALANDDEKARCSAMNSNGKCKICPDNCHWKKHANTPYIFEFINVKVKKTYADMQKKYKEATGKLLSQEQIVEKMGEELGDLLDDIEDMMIIIKTCNERLEEIALRPNPLSMTDHIDLMIENERLENKDGCLQRINILKDFRKRTQISTDFDTLRKEAQSTLGTVGKKRNRDPKTVLARVEAWFKKPFS